MNKLGRTAFVEVCAAGLEVDGPSCWCCDDMGPVGITRCDDAATAFDFVVHCRKPQSAVCADDPGERRAGERPRILGMSDCGADRFSIADERHLLTMTGKQLGHTRFAQRTEARDVADCLHAADNLFPDVGRDVGM